MARSCARAACPHPADEAGELRSEARRTVELRVVTSVKRGDEVAARLLAMAAPFDAHISALTSRISGQAVWSRRDESLYPVGVCGTKMKSGQNCGGDRREHQ